MNSYRMNKEVWEIISRIEEHQDLLKYEVDGWCIWPKLRFSVFRSVQNRPDDSSSFRLGKVFLLITFICDLFNFSICGKKYFFWTQSTRRMEKVGELYKDIFVDDIILALGNSYKCETINNVKAWEKQKKALVKSQLTTTLFDFIIYKLSSSGYPKRFMKTANKIHNDIKSCIQEFTISEQKIKSSLLEFYWGKKLHKIFFRIIKPKYVFMVTYRSYMVAAAKELGITTIELQHGFMDKYHQAYSWTPYAVRYKSKMPLPDNMFMFGDYWVDEMKKTGFWTDELVSVGSLRMDQYRSGIRRCANRPLKLLLSTMGFDTDRLIDFMREFLFIVKDNLEISLSIKLHPVYDTSYDKWVSNFKEFDNVHIYPVDSEYSTFELLVDTDVNLSIWSTTHFEAVGLGKPTIVLPLRGWENMQSLINDNFFLFVNTPSELFDTVSDFKNKECNTKGKGIGNYFYKENAIDNILKFVSL